jgi:hypothetical protein
MLALILFFLLQYPPHNTGPRAGVEISLDGNPDRNFQAMNTCINLSAGAGCNVRITPGTYYLKRSVWFPNGVLQVDFTGVTVAPCADMPWMFQQSTIGPWVGAVRLGLNENTASYTAPCGSFKQLREVWHWS